MPTEILMLAKDFPKALKTPIQEEIFYRTIAFLQPGERGLDVLGTGVLAKVKGRHAILTADHVAENLPPGDEIPIFLERAETPYRLPRKAISISRHPRGQGKTRRDGPDLAVIHLAPDVAGAIGAKRKFFTDLDRYRDLRLERDEAFWFVQGFPQEGTKILDDHLGAPGKTTYLYNFTGWGGPDVVDPGEGKYDYVDLPVSDGTRPDVPWVLNGMSGGGIWRVRLTEGGAKHLPPILTGIMFYQDLGVDDGHEAAINVRGHAWRTIYEVAYSELASS